MVKSVFSLYITIMINILHEIITILHEKLLKVIYFYWLHNDASEENSTLNDRSNGPRING